MLYMTVWAIKHRSFVNNFAYETAEINIEVKHLLHRIERITMIMVTSSIGKISVMLIQLRNYSQG